MIEVSVKTNFDQVMRDLHHEHDDLVQKAGSMAINRAATRAKTEAVRAITAEFRIQASKVRVGLFIKKASRSHLHAELTIDAYSHSKGRALNLVDFLRGNPESLISRPGVRKRRAPRFQIRKTGAAKPVQNAFVAKMASGKVLVLQRTGDKRYPVKDAATIGIGQMFNTRRVNKRVVAFIEKQFPIEFQRAIDLQLARLRE